MQVPGDIFNLVQISCNKKFLLTLLQKDKVIKEKVNGKDLQIFDVKICITISLDCVFCSLIV